MGWMIGAGIGSIVDPQQIQGRQWNNQTMQGSQDGLARAVVFGTGTVVGNLLDSEPKPRKGTRKESAGKGGPEINHDTAKLTYAIEICDSSELRGTKVNGVIAVWEDERLVYDVRPGTQLSAADSAKWLKNKRFFYGEETQVPPPELEAIHGVGNVPAYRGTCGMVVWDEDLMVDIKDNPRGRMPTYRFLVSVCGVVTPPAGQILITGSAKVSGGGHFVLATAEDVPVVTQLAQADGADIAGATSTWADDVWLTASNAGTRHLTGTLAVGAAWSSGTISETAPNGIEFAERGGGEWVLKELGGTPSGITSGSKQYTGSPASFSYIEPVTYNTLGGVMTTRFQAQRYTNDHWYGSMSRTLVRAASINGPFNAVWDAARNTAAGWDNNGPSIIAFYDVLQVGGRFYAIIEWDFLVEHRTYRLWWSPDGGVTWPVENVEFEHSSDDGYPPVQLVAVGGNVLALCRNFDVITNAGGSFARVSTGLVAGPGAAGYVEKYSARKIATDGNRVYVVGGDKLVVSLDRGLTWSAPITLPIHGVKSISISSTTPIPETYIEIPDSDGYYAGPNGEVTGPSLGEGSMCGMPLDVVVRKLHDLGAPQIVDADVDFIALENDTVRGYVVQDASLTVADACDPLRRVFTFDLSSYDLKIRAVKRGGPIAWVVDPDDLVAGENTSDSSTRGQGVEYPKKLHVGYIDPALDYKLTTQISERYSTSINVVGEDRLDTLLTLSADEGAQAAHKLHKILWTELEDTRGFTLPLEYLKAAPADLFSYQGRRYRVEQMRIEGMRIVFENAAYDRASAYVSNATGVQGQAPPSPGSSLRGPTVSAAMNLPVINDSYDRAGFWWAASGLLDGWSGSLLQVSRDGVTFADGPSVTASATMGVLTEALPAASRYGQDTTNALKVKLTPTSGTLDTLAFEALIAGDNAAAILYQDGTAEIIQWQTATETAPREYTLTGLLRGRQDTAIALHAEGAQFVVLDDAIRFIAVEPSDLGQTFTLRPVSLGTDPTANATQTITLTTLESLREWQPEHVAWERDSSNDMLIEWVGRARLGSSRIPVHSQHFGGYLVTVKNGATSHSWETTEQALLISAADQTTHFGGYAFTPTEVTVVAISRVQQGAVGTPVAFPSGLAGWVPVQAGWSEVGGVAQYDPTVSGESVGYLYLNDPQPFALGSGKTFRGEVDVGGLGTGGLSVGAVACFRLNGSTYVGATLGNVDHPHSTLVAYPTTSRTHCAVGVVAITDGTNAVTFQNLTYAIT